MLKICCWFRKSAGVKCDHLKLEMRTHVRAHLNLDMRGACVRPKKRLQLNLVEMAKKYPHEFLNLFCNLDTFRQTQHFRNLQEYSVDVNLLLNLIELCTILAFPFFLFLWKNIHPTSRSLGHWGPAKSHIVQLKFSQTNLVIIICAL